MLPSVYVKGIKQLAWRDTHVKITGAAVYGLQRAFLVDWFFVSRELITDHVLLSCQQGC